MFDTQYTRIGHRFQLNSGSGVEKDFTLSVNSEGEEYFEQTGETDRYERIQSFREGTELASLLDKFSRSEIDPFTLSQKLNAVNGVYMDTVGMPTSYAELFQRAKEAEQSFAKLPADVKAKFDNSHMVFWSQMGTQRFNEVMAEYYGSRDVQVDQSTGEVVESVGEDVKE